MRWTSIAAFVSATLLSPALAGCGDAGPKAKQVQERLAETFGAMKSWGIEKKDEFVKGASPKLDELKQKFAEVKASAAGTTKEASQQLEEGWAGLQQRFDAMKASTGEEWARQRDAFLAAYEAYKQKLTNPPGN